MNIPGSAKSSKNWLERTHSKELVDCYKSLMGKFPEECKTYYIEGVIKDAELTLVGNDDDGEN